MTQLAHANAVTDALERPALSRTARLERWAELLERQPNRQLNTLRQTEHRDRDARNAMRVVDSPISVAFDDALLKYQGLTGDTYGEALGFFQLNDHELHNILCYCHYGPTVSAGEAALLVRRVIARSTRPNLLARLRQLLGRAG